jgi:hypothetical protein
MPGAWHRERSVAGMGEVGLPPMNLDTGGVPP